MGLVATIADRLEVPVLRRSGLELIDVRGARRIIDECRRERVTVLGIEGFHVREDQTVPDMGAIADFSMAAQLPSSERIARTTADAEAFLDAVGDRELLFDITLALEEG
jgi:hypothetical protein